MKPVHVMHVVGVLDRGGAEMRTLELLRHLDSRCVRFSFLTQTGERGSLSAKAEALGAAVHPLPLSATFAGRFRELLRALQVDVLQSHVHYFSGFLLREAARAGIRGRIAHFRSTSDGQPHTVRRTLQRRLMRTWIDKHATAIAAVSRAAMESAWGLAWADDYRCRVLHNGLDLRPFAVASHPEVVRAEFKLPPQCPLFIHVGNIHRAKNHSKLIEVFGEIVKREDRARLLIVGRDPAGLGAKVMEQIGQRHLNQHVVMTGERSDVPRLLKAADVMIFPSLREGLPGAVLEACAAGLNVVGSDIPGMIEIAAYFPTIQCLSVHAPASVWADAALSASKASSNHGDVDPIRYFSQTPFDLSRARDAYLELLALSLG